MRESFVVLNEVPLYGLALEQVEGGAAEEPKDDINEVGPPEDAQLRVAYQEQTFIKVE